MSIDYNPSIRRKTTFRAFCDADVYSFALVLWEVLHRTDVGEEVC